MVDQTAGIYRCARCGHVHGPVEENLYALLAAAEAPLTAAGPVRGEHYDRGRFSLKVHYCPGCFTQVDVQIQLRDGVTREFRLINGGGSTGAKGKKGSS